MVSELTWEEDIVQLQKLGLLIFGLSPQSISKSMLGWLSIEGRIFLSKRNSISNIFSFRCKKLGLSIEEEFLSEPSIGFISS